jgi:hypothetical protein
MGLVKSPNDLRQMPESVAKQVISVVAGTFPNAFEKNPDNVNVIDGKLMDPSSKDAVLQSSLDMHPEERAMRIGGVYAGYYVAQKAPIAPQVKSSPRVDLSKLNSSLQDIQTSSSPSTPSSDTLTELEKLTNAQGRHAGDMVH